MVGAEIGHCAHDDQLGARGEMSNFRVPLQIQGRQGPNPYAVQLIHKEYNRLTLVLIMSNVSRFATEKQRAITAESM